MSREEIKPNSTLRPGKWSGDTPSSGQIQRQLFGVKVWSSLEFRKGWKPSAVRTESSQPCLGRDCPWEGGEKGNRGSILPGWPQIWALGECGLINSSWNPAGTGIGVTLKSKHRQPNE